MMRVSKNVQIALLSCAFLTAGIPSVASADDGGGRYHDARAGDRYYRDHDDRGRKSSSTSSSHDRTNVRIDINLGRPRYEPVYEERTTRVWVEPVYQTVCDRVWIEPVYRTECERVWVPDRWEHRDVVYRERGRKVIRQERVLIERGHWREVERQVLVCDGYWKTIERQDLVREGRWEYRTERVRVSEAPRYGGLGFDLFASLPR